MNKNEMKDQIFEVMLQTAVTENFQKECQQLPTAKELTEQYELSQPTRIKIENMIREANRRLKWRRIQKAAKKVAVIVAILIPVTMVSLLSVEASRNAIFNAVMNWESDHVKIKYQDGAVSSSEPEEPGSSTIKPQYLPEGFAETETAKIGLKNRTEYQNTQGISIYFELTPLSAEGSVALDSEHTTRKEIEIHGKKAILLVAKTSGGTSYLAWEDKTYSFLLSSEISPEELTKIAESIKK
ncbi:DUF4367 domain-containing protein [Faecalispora anaeroviscerum]|uniref:DUF4367 domain-containing protein n=1 Tax=Faecalispora anaeroviscerum TaxID=2991836 RepID=UPI0024B94F14|nr:DUF4367 domain-containing protein [Faecalispora anaeroviscerum]